ncbi:unnamed protein product [Heterosigma akashiwo]
MGADEVLRECSSYGPTGECPTRHKCYQEILKSEDGKEKWGQRFICMCNRSLMTSGDSCEGVHPFAPISTLVAILVLCFLMRFGSRLIIKVLKRRSAASRRTSSLFVCAMAALMVNLSMLAGSVLWLFNELAVGSWFWEQGVQLILQEIVLFFILGTTLGASHHSLVKLQEVGAIRGRTLLAFQIANVALLIAAPAVTVFYLVVPGRRHQDNESKFRAAVGCLCLSFLLFANRRVCSFIDQGTAATFPGSPSAAAAHLVATKLMVFTKAYILSCLLAVFSDLVWTFCDRNYTLIPAICANFMLKLRALSLSSCCFVVYADLGSSVRNVDHNSP